MSAGISLLKELIATSKFCEQHYHYLTTQNEDAKNVKSNLKNKKF